MNKFGAILLVALGTFCFAPSSHAQAPVYAPLSLFITGSGQISPFANGELLAVGQNYEMQAIPDPGFAFSSWQPVNIFTFTEFTFDAGGNPNPPITSTFLSPGAIYSEQPVMNFTMQPSTVILDIPARTVTESFGWQANFVPTPEPSTLVLMVSGLLYAAIRTARRMNGKGSLRCWKYLRLFRRKPPCGFKSSKM